MRYLLDTRCFLWWLGSPERLSAEAAAIIGDRSNDILVSVASSWEIASKYALGKLPLPAPPEEYIPSRLQRCGFGTAHIEHVHALRVAALPPHHRDLPDQDGGNNPQAGECAMDILVPLPAGAHTVQVDNDGADWYSVDSYTFVGFR